MPLLNYRGSKLSVNTVNCFNRVLCEYFSSLCVHVYDFYLLFASSYIAVHCRFCGVFMLLHRVVM